MPPSMREWLNEGHLAWFIVDAVGQMDLREFYAAYRNDGWGAAAYDPAMVEELPADVGGLEAALLTWNHIYESVRPHQALGYKTPDQFYRDWLISHPKREEVLSDMS